VTNFRNLPYQELKDYARKEIILLKTNIIQVFDSREEGDELVLVLEVTIYSIKNKSYAKWNFLSF
jgi:hypothetical protein